MICPKKGCKGEMESRFITHTFLRHGQPIVFQNIHAEVCSLCGFTVLDLDVLDAILAFDPDAQEPISMAPVYWLENEPSPA
jgi:YgiT-type zinc finger domain-containing protein